MDLPLILALLLMSMFFSGSESALFSIRWWRIIYLKHHGGKAGRRLAELMEHPGSVLMTILLGNTLANVAVSSVFEHAMEKLFPDHGLILAIGVMTPVVMIFCEITPKTLALHNPEGIGLAVTPPIRLLAALIAPVRLLAERFSLSISRSVRSRMAGRDHPDFLAIVDDGRRAGILTESEHHVMTRILGMKSMPVTDVMIPRTEMIALPDTIDFDGAVRAILQYDFKRIPIYHGALDNIVGVLYAKDLLGGWLNPVLRRSPRALARSPVFVPSHITLKQLSLELMRRKRHLAIVLDEYGGTAGMITHNDMLRTIFQIGGHAGDTQHILDAPQEGGWRVDARIGWSDLSRKLRLTDPDVPFRTLNGFLMDRFGRVPAPGEFTVVSGMSGSGETVKWRLTVETVEPIRIQHVRIAAEPVGGERPGEAGNKGTADE